jgi:hypothetical protein
LVPRIQEIQWIDGVERVRGTDSGKRFERA